MKEKAPQYDVGVLIGRFQVHELHDGHHELIRHVCRQHSKVVIVLGLSPLPTSVNNPLDFEARKKMLLAAYPDVTVLYIKDEPTDNAWSRKLDTLVRDVLVPGQSAVLYGGRDSFASHYTGSFPVIELEESRGRFLSGTAIRKQIARASVKGSPDFRAGVIWASQARFPTSFQCVDIAPLNEDGTKVLLGRKPNETAFRFLGGFVDPGSGSLEDNARREAMEEGGIELAECTYVGSTPVDDWRYRNEPDRILTALFAGKVLHGRPRPGDDIEEVGWFGLPPFDVDSPQRVITARSINPTHRTLLEMLVRYLKEQGR